MKIEKARHKKKLLFPIAGLFTILSCVSIGFATWVTLGGSVKSVSGMFDADEAIENVNEIEVFDNVTIDSFSFAENYGFLNTSSKKYGLTTTLTGSCRLNIAKASELIESMSTNKRMLLSFGIYSSYTNFETRFSSTSIALDQTNITINQQGSITSVAGIISKDFTITVPNSNYVTISFSFVLTCTNGGKTPGEVDYFPNLSTYPISIKLTPGEAS